MLRQLEVEGFTILQRVLFMDIPRNASRENHRIATAHHLPPSKTLKNAGGCLVHVISIRKKAIKSEFPSSHQYGLEKI